MKMPITKKGDVSHERKGRASSIKALRSTGRLGLKRQNRGDPDLAGERTSSQHQKGKVKIGGVRIEESVGGKATRKGQR